MTALRIVAFGFAILFCAVGLPLMAFAIGVKVSPRDSLSDMCRKLAA